MDTVPVSAVPVNKYRAGVRGKSAKAAPMTRPVNSERESALKLDGNSLGFSCDAACRLYGPLDRLAAFGIVPLTPKVSEVKL